MSIIHKVYALLMITVYYDYEQAIGVNATCVEWSPRNLFFKSWSEFSTYLFVEYGHGFELVEITAENYPELCALGVFYE